MTRMINHRTVDYLVEATQLKAQLVLEFEQMRSGFISDDRIPHPRAVLRTLRQLKDKLEMLRFSLERTDDLPFFDRPDTDTE